MDQENDTFEAEQKNLWPWLAGIVIGLLVLAATGWLGRSAYRHFKERHEQAQAQAFLAKGDYRSALLSARQALTLNPTNVPVCRVMAALADLSHSPTALDWQRRIVQTEPTVENKLLLAGAALRYQNAPFPLTTQILNELTPAATNRAGYQVVAAGLALGTRHLTEAESHFETAAALEPTNQLHQLNLAIIRLGMTNETKAAAARRVLEQMRMDTNLGPAALRALVVDRLGHKDLAAANDFSAQLLVRPQAMLADRLQQLGILQQLKSGDFAARLQAVQQSSATNSVAAAQMAVWMQGNGLLAGSIQWLTNLPAGVRSQSPVRLALADGYLQSADWRTLRDFTAKGNWEEMEFLRLALLSRAWAQQDMKAEAASNWGAAVGEAGSRYSALTTLLGLAERWKTPDQQAGLLERIVEKFPQERWAQQALAETYFAAGKTADLHRLYARLFALYPKDFSFENNLAATALLLKTNVARASQWAAEAYAQSPGNPDAASTYAFALHLQGRDEEGLAVLQKFPPRQLEAPSVALYYGVLLAATHNAYATTYLQIARTRGHLLPEEQQLLEAAQAE